MNWIVVDSDTKQSDFGCHFNDNLDFNEKIKFQLNEEFKIQFKSTNFSFICPFLISFWWILTNFQFKRFQKMTYMLIKRSKISRNQSKTTKSIDKNELFRPFWFKLSDFKLFQMNSTNFWLKSSDFELLI